MADYKETEREQGSVRSSVQHPDGRANSCVFDVSTARPLPFSRLL